MLLGLSAEMLMAVARNPKFLGAEVGFFSVLHSWTQQLKHHPHVQCVVPAGGLSFDHQRWVPADPRYRFFLPKWVLRRVFRGKVKDAYSPSWFSAHLDREVRKFLSYSTEYTPSKSAK
jgi:hypothetical protein